LIDEILKKISRESDKLENFPNSKGICKILPLVAKSRWEPNQERNEKHT
jgi:hypothetical protein